MKNDYNKLVASWKEKQITTGQLNEALKDLNKKYGSNKYTLAFGKIKGRTA